MSDDQQTETADVEFADFDPSDLSSLTPQQAAEAVIQTAVELNASDVYILTGESNVVVSVRRLGRVERVAALTREHGGALLRSIKANAGMDIAETRRPLDGRYLHELGDTKVDLRINSIPTLFGQDLTCRVLDRSGNLMSLDQLGMTHTDLSNLKAMLSSPSGLILVTGPTGTGKTTTLYAGMQHLNDGSRKINTLEDPIEYSMDGVRQSQVNPKLSLNFSDLLRNVLRQAPDVIMIGEIRDEETATTAVRAANSGHLVMATLHAPVAAGAVQSMLALGSNPYFLASCLLGVVAQRLIRVLSPESRIAYDISASPETFAEIESLLGPDEGQTIYGPDPTDENSQGGYNTRTGLFEVMMMSQAIRKLVADGRPSQEIEKAAIESGMVAFRRSALLKVAQGITSTEEMLRSLPSEYLGLED